MPASIIINQSGKPAGSPSTSRDDLATGTLVTLTNATAESTYLWELLSRPVGSSASLSGATLPTATFTPDVTGSYRIRLTTNGSEVDIRIGAVKTSNLGIRKPATNEETEFDATDGWGAAQQAMIDTLDSRDAENFKRDGSVPATSDFDMDGNTVDDAGGVRLRKVSDPSTVANQGSVYVKDHFGDAELFYRDASGNIVQLTKDGVVNAAGGGGGSGRVFVSSNDTNDGYLSEKIVPGLNSVVTQLFDGGDERLRVETTEVVQLPEQLSDPVFTGLDGYLYTKDVAGITELFYMDSAGTVTQVTSDGYLDTFESLRGVGLFEQSSDPSTAVEKGFVYARPSDGYTELFYKGSSGHVTPLTRRGELVGFNGSVALEDSDSLSADTPISPVSTPTSGGGWVDNHLDSGLEVTINTAEGELVLISVSGWASDAAGGTGGNSLFYHFTVDGVTGVPHGQSIDANASTSVFASEYRTLGAGTHLIKLRVGGEAGEDITLRSGLELSVARFRGELRAQDPDTAPPQLFWADVASVDVRTSLTDFVDADEIRITLQDGKQRRFSGTLTFDFANGIGDLGLDTGSEASDTWYYLYLIPDFSDDTKLSLRASASAPLTGPSGYANYRYIGAFRNDSSSDILKFYHSGGPTFTYANRQFITLSTSAGGPDIEDLDPYVPVTAEEAEVAAWIQVTGTSQAEVRLWPFGDSGGLSRIQSHCGTNGETDAAFVGGAIPVPGETKRIEQERAIFTGGINQAFIFIFGWEDGYLEPGIQPPPVPAPDAPLPQLTYETAGSVSVAAPPGLPSTVRQTLQDGKQRSFSGMLTFDFANGVADGGLDTGSEASDTWYYLYLVPKLTDDNQLAVRASVNPPYTGPSGYTNYRYVGAVRNDSSSDLLLFYQKGDNFDYASRQIVATDTTVDVSPVQQDLTDFVPQTSSHANVLLYSQTTSGFGNMSVWVTGTQGGGMATAHFWAGSPTSFTANNTIDFVPTPGDAKEIYTQKTSTAGINGSELAVNGWIDGYLTSAGGGGGGLAQISLDGAYDNGRSITADSGPVEIDASGLAALRLDGYLTLVETSDPGAVVDAGSLYSKEIGGVTELFYLDDFGSAVQLTDNGSAAGSGGGSGFDGSYLQFNEQVSDPTPTADDGYLYTKDVSGLTELFYMDSAGTVTQMTSDGYLTTPQIWEEEFSAAGGSESFILSNSVAPNANTLSGFNIIGVFRNGLRSRFQNSPSAANEWGFSAPGTVDFVSLTGGDIITVVYEA